MEWETVKIPQRQLAVKAYRTTANLNMSEFIKLQQLCDRYNVPKTDIIRLAIRNLYDDVFCITAKCGKCYGGNGL
jgi:hypothetical protein